MERILELVTMISTGANSASTLIAEYFLFRIYDIPLPQCGSIFVLLNSP